MTFSGTVGGRAAPGTATVSGFGVGSAGQVNPTGCGHRHVIFGHMASCVPSWDFPRTLSATQVAVGVAGRHGMSPQRCLAGSGLVPQDLDHSAQEVEARQELCVVRNVVRFFDDRPGLGAEAGKLVTVSMLGILGFAMMASATARDAIRISDRFGYGTLSPLFLQPRVEEQPDATRIVYDETEVPAEVRNFFIERDLALCVSMLPHMFGAEPRVRITTTLQGARARAFAEVLPGSHAVEPGQDCNAIIIGSESLCRHLPNADEHTVKECEHYLQQLMSRRVQRSGVALRIRAAMLRHRPIVPSLAVLAAERSVDPRTLRRQLAEEGTSYRQLADEVKQTVSEPLLAAGLTVEQVAERLGYADAAAFSRAFKRWTGRSPGGRSDELSAPKSCRSQRCS